MRLGAADRIGQREAHATGAPRGVHHGNPGRRVQTECLRILARTEHQQRRVAHGSEPVERTLQQRGPVVQACTALVVAETSPCSRSQQNASDTK